MSTPQVRFLLEVSPETEPVRGNATACCDKDREAEDAILADLEAGNVWAWASVKVTAQCAGYSGVDYLGCCNYANEASFRADGYWADMKREALCDLMNTLDVGGTLFLELDAMDIDVDAGDEP